MLQRQPNLLIPIVCVLVALHWVTGERVEAQQLPSLDTFLNSPVCDIRPEDEIWVASARDAVCCNSVSNDLTEMKLVNSRWQPVSNGALANGHAGDVSRRTVVYVHGWRTDGQRAIRQGLDAYKSMTECGSVPIRFVIWSWRAEKTKRRFKNDYLEKSHNAVELGRTLSDYLAHFHDRNMTLIGHSLGAQVILSSLTMPSKLAPTESRYNVILAAPAINCQFGHCINSSPEDFAEQTNKTIVIHGAPDIVLAIGNKKLCKMETGAKLDVRAMVECGKLPLGQIRWYDTKDTRKRHDINFYLKSREFRCNLPEMLAGVVSSTVLEPSSPPEPVTE